MKHTNADPNRQMNFLATVSEKTCTRCRVSKPSNSFGAKYSAPDGLRDWCNECGQEYQQKYYHANLEINRKRKREYMARQREDPRKNERIKERARFRHSQHKTKVNAEARRKWAERFFWARAAKLGDCSMCSSLSRKWKEQRGRCALSGFRLTRENAQLDHIVPRAKGGSNELSNLRWTHKDLNLAKRDLTDDDFLALCGSVVSWLGRRILAASEAQ